MKKHKVLFFIYRLGGGGAARTILNIVNHLDRKKFEPILVTLNFTSDYESEVKDDITFVKLNTSRLRFAIVPLIKLIRKEKPDLIFSTVSTYNLIAILSTLLSFTKTKIIVREAALLGGNRKTDLMLRLYGLFYRFAHKIVALSEGVKENIIQRYNVNREKIIVIYNPVDLRHIEQKMNCEDDLRNDMQILFDSNKRIIISAGRFVKEKDQKTLIQAFAKIQKETNSKLVILGEGELEIELYEIAKKNGIQDHVHFIGFQQNPYVYFKKADLFVLTSLTEGFGHVLVEAMVTGTPIVSTRSKPGAEEVLNNGEYGILCNIGDVDDIANKIKVTLTLPKDLRDEMIKKGYERATNFDVNKIIKQYEALFLEIIDNK